MFWRGFWDGFRGEAWRIVLTGVVMVVLCVAGGGTVGAIALKLSVLAFLSTMILINAFTQYVELGKVLSTAFTLKEVGNSLRDEASRFSNLGYHGTASMLSGAADEIARIARSIEVNFSSIWDFIARVGTDLSLWEWEVLLGLRKAEPYENGRVWGKATGIAISLLEFLAGFCYLAVSGATSASLGAKAKTVLHGIWNWLTPAMTDAISVVRNMPKMAKGCGMLVSAISRIRELGIPVIEALKMDAEGAINLAGIFGKILDAAKERKISDEAVQAIREICARAAELGEEATEKLAGSIDTLLSKNTEFIDGFATWANEANPSMEWVVEITGKLAKLDEDALGDIGKAWMLNEDADDFYELLKGLSMALELGQQRQGEIFTLLHRSVETGDRDNVVFVSKMLGWISEARETIQYEARGYLTDEAVELANNVLDFKLSEDKMLQITDILGNLLEYRRDEIGPHAVEGVPGSHWGIFYSFKKGLEDAGLGGGTLDPALLEDCLNKWSFTSKIKYGYVQLGRPAGDDFGSSVPFEMNYLIVSGDKCIPVRASLRGEIYDVRIPKDAVEYLKSVEWSPGRKYLQGVKGFLIFVKDLPQGAKEVVPVKVDSEGKIFLTGWFERMFEKKPECMKYFDESGVIKWDELEKEHMFLEIEVSKGQDKITRLFAFTERKQEGIRVSVRELAKKDDVVECVLKLASAEDFLQDKYMVPGEVAQAIVERAYRVMQYETREELDAALAPVPDPLKYDLIGAWGEWKVFQIICEHKGIFGEIIGCQVYEGGAIIDFITTKYLVEVKNWGWEAQNERLREINRNSLIEQMKGYRMAQDSRYGDKKVVVFFYREMPRDVIGDESKGLISDLLKIFQDRSRFEIVNGVNELSKLG